MNLPARIRGLAGLVLAGALVLAFYQLLRVGIHEPWGHDDYYHLALAREMLRSGPLEEFPWTPFSLLAERFVDKEPLFHVLLLPFAGLPIDAAARAGSALGQAFLIAAAAWVLASCRAPAASVLLLGLAAMGPFFAARLEQVRPHVWMLGFCALVVGLLARRASPWLLGAVSAAFALTHVAAWVAVPFALVFAAAERWPAMGEGRWRLAPVLASAGGWLAGQLLHPNLPRNFWLVWAVNVEVPLASAGATTPALREAIGVELLPANLPLLLLQWPVFVPPLVAIVQLVRRPHARTPAALATTALSVAFLVGSALLLRRLLEVGALLGLLALAFVLAARAEHEDDPPLRSRGVRAGALLAVLVGAAWTVYHVREFGRGDGRPLGNARPLPMARFLAEAGQPGEVVFTAQWADSAPLFYAAPHLRSLVALDPTFFHAQDPYRFGRYWAIAHGRSGDPVGEIRRLFGARYVAIWKAPGFRPLALQLRRDRRAALAFDDPGYEVWRLSG